MMRHVLALSMLLVLATALPTYTGRSDEDSLAQLSQTLDAMSNRPYAVRSAIGDLIALPSGVFGNWEKRSLGDVSIPRGFDYDNFENQMNNEALQSKIPRKRDWKSFRGAWGKRDPGWKNLTGFMWG